MSPPCASGPPPKYCLPDCRRTGANPCKAGTTCDSSTGLCAWIPCDAPDFPGCLTGMTCDPSYDPATELPGRYYLFGTDQDPNVQEPLGAPALTEAQRDAAAAGCVFLRCDESGSYHCAEGFECDVDDAGPTSIGCLPLSCEEVGQCVSASFVCEPTSSNPRPAGRDFRGCVPRNCDEGHACGPDDLCDFSKPGDDFGCAPVSCEESGRCPMHHVCDPAPAMPGSGQAPAVDKNGCRSARCELDEYACPNGKVCAPEQPNADMFGCTPAPPPPSTGGASGTGGTGARAGSSNGETGGSASGGAGSTGSDAGTSGAPPVSGSSGTSGAPARSNCRQDSDCAGQYCVNGACSSELGLCR